ncbi:MAG: DEAD/DEAH box helicase, partial [Kangiellaceae bacterium]|nr:DEAD/DEAH box helicase [Kangiellaceae bacterium]
KQQETFNSEADYLNQWLKKQNHDPFPNMARHRVVYILNEENGLFQITLHKAYLTQQNEYQIKAPLDINTNITDKLPKFVSLTDQEILAELQTQLRAKPTLAPEKHMFLLAPDPSHPSKIEQTLIKIVESGRCFWRASHRQPLSFSQTTRRDEKWLEVTDSLLLNRAESKVYQHRAYNHSQLSLLKSLHHPEFKPDWLTPRIRVNSHQLSMDWKDATLFEFDTAEVSFIFELTDGKQIELNYTELLHVHQGGDSLANRQLMEIVAGKLHLLEWIGSIKSNFEPPIARHFDVTTRFLEGDFGHWFPMLRGLYLERWQVEFAHSFRLNQQKVSDWYSRVTQVDKAAVDQSWFELEVGVKVDGEAVNILPFIVEALRNGQLDLSTQSETIAIKLDDNRVIGINRSRVQSIVNTLIELSENKPLINQKLTLPESQLVRVNLLEKELQQSAEWMDANKLQEKAKALAQSEGITRVNIPKNVCAELREYQKRGVDWLQFLGRQQIGGILADDMGLGKTLQTLTHIQIEKNSGRMQGPCMVVAPTSLLGNWLAEANKFTPELNLVHWAGTRRQLQGERLRQADIIVTSYGLLLRDFAQLNQLPLHLLVLDEAQAIKNSRTKVSKIAFSMTSKLRLCLTGTPLENHLGELWSLFHFLMPGLLGEQAQFKRLFQLPIEKEQDWSRQQQLSQRIAPFMLRRTKDKVASDLPTKTEIAEVIELNQEQADLYETVRMSMLEEVQKAMTQNTRGGNQLLIGNALLRLRQICCHPNLVDFGQAQQSDSAKLAWLKAVLPELVQSGSKVLIFSSFTSMLAIISEELQELNIEHLTLTGQTRQRS